MECLFTVKEHQLQCRFGLFLLIKPVPQYPLTTIHTLFPRLEQWSQSLSEVK